MIFKEQKQLVPKILAQYCAQNIGSVGTDACMSWKMNRAHKQTEIRMLKKERQTLLEISRKMTNCAKTLSTVLCSNFGNH